MKTDIEKKLLVFKLKGYQFIWQDGGYSQSKSPYEFHAWFECVEYPCMSDEDWRLYHATKSSFLDIEKAKAEVIKKLEIYLGH